MLTCDIGRPLRLMYVERHNSGGIESIEVDDVARTCLIQQHPIRFVEAIGLEEQVPGHIGDEGSYIVSDVFFVFCALRVRIGHDVDCSDAVNGGYSLGVALNEVAVGGMDAARIPAIEEKYMHVVIGRANVENPLNDFMRSLLRPRSFQARRGTTAPSDFRIPQRLFSIGAYEIVRVYCA